MHYRKYRLALVFAIAFVIGSALNLWYIWVSAFLNDELEVTFTINQFHELGIEFVLACFFVLVLGWLAVRWREVKRFMRIVDKEELRPIKWWE